jgi:hypothetical protein
MSLQAEATTQPAENPGSPDFPGFLFVAVKLPFFSDGDFARACVAKATPLGNSHPSVGMAATADIVIAY